MLANNFPGWPRSVLPAQWARGYWEDETGEVPAKSCFNSRRCTITPGKTVAWVYSFCEDPGGCFFYILIPASYILQETQRSPNPGSFYGGCYFYRCIATQRFTAQIQCVMCQRETAGGKLTAWTGAVRVRREVFLSSSLSHYKSRPGCKALPL